MAKVQTGDVVQVHYTGQLPNGEVFGSSRESEPLQFKAGSEEVLPGVSKAVIGMETGEKKTVAVPPEEAFGSRQEQLQQSIPRNSLPEDAKVGDRFLAQAGEQQIPVWVRELDEQSAIVDGNHPLAGHTLNFELEVLNIVNSDGASQS